MKKTTIVRASTLPGENSYLHELVYSNWDCHAYQNYARWLATQNDPRGAFLFEFADSLNDLRNKKLPRSGQYPSIWENLVGLTLAKYVSEDFCYYDFDVVSLHPSIMQMCEPSISITPTLCDDGKFEMGESKFGGFPHLPKSKSWPAYEGVPMGFIGQLNLEDFHETIVAQKLPSHGLLSFFLFYDANGGDIPAIHREDERAVEIIYTKELTDLGRVAPPEVLILGNSVAPACKLTLTEGLDVPESRYGDGSSRFSEDIVNQCGEDELQEVMSGFAYELHDHIGDSHLFGCAHDGAGWAPTLRNNKNFLTLGSEKNLDWCWLDDYHLHFSISADCDEIECLTQAKVDIC